jgi:hypothetical protein
LGDRQRAIDEVTLACGLTDGFRDFARDEPDLDNLRNDPTFRQLLRQTGATSEPDDPAGEEDEDDDDSADAPPAHGLN